MVADVFRNPVIGEVIGEGREEDYLLYHFLREKVGYGFLEGFLADPYLEDISIPGAGNIFVFHRIFGSLEANICIPGGAVFVKSQDELLQLLDELEAVKTTA